MPVLVFRGIRYATCDRFGPARLIEQMPRWSTERGPLSPQQASAFDMVMGQQAALRQSEDCQVLSVFTPSQQGKRAVMVFIHGGAFMAGGGELPWYDGAKLAGEQEVVVVTITYRLGALGYLLMADHAGPSPGMTDQIAGLQWIKRHIHAFGGDPDNVTVFGQSAGGLSILGLLEWGCGSELFNRAIIQSGVGAGRRRRSDIAAYSSAFLQFLASDPRKIDPTELVRVQAAFIREKRMGGWMPLAPEVPASNCVDLLIGWTRDDALPIVLISTGKSLAPETDLTQLQPDIDKMNDLFEQACRQLAQQTTAAGHSAWLYRFDWCPQGSRLGAPHCVDLPFLLGEPDAWRTAPMLGGVTGLEIETLGKKMRAYWASFARGEAPASDWSVCSDAAQPLNIIPNQ